MVNFLKKEQNCVHSILTATVTELSFLWKQEPLDGDQTEWISLELLRQLDLFNGNE